MIHTLKIKGKKITPQKSIKNPLIGEKNVLTNSRWEFVDLWLRRNNKEEARYFWKQSKEFHNASLNLNLQSSPLLHYYSFMNATKALLTSKEIEYDKYHGVIPLSIQESSEIDLSNECIKIKNSGILPSLSEYYEEEEENNQHSLKELFFNLQYIHRTYCLSHTDQEDLFIPLKDVFFVFDDNDNKLFLQAVISHDFSDEHLDQKLPEGFIIHNINEEGKIYIKSEISISIVDPNNLTEGELTNLIDLNKNLRKKIKYINGSHTLWYLKSNIDNGPSKINRSTPTITLGTMHKLSDLCRYKPFQLNSFLSSEMNWLLNEFINQAPNQFLDQIASEITGYNFLQPNIRKAT